MMTHQSPATYNPGKPSLHVRIPPDARHARTVRDALIGFTSLHAVSEGDVEAIVFAIGEAIANAIEHGAPSADIEVTVEIAGDEIIGRVVDHGRGLSEVPEGLAPLPDGFTERGRGIPIMQRCADHVEVMSEPGEGTVVTIVRYRRTPNNQERTAAS